MLPTDPADLFIRLCDDLDPNAAASGAADEWDEDDQVQEIALLVEEQAVLGGDFDSEEVEEQLELADDIDARRYAYLLGLDRAFASVHPNLDAVDRGELTALAARFRLTGRLNTEATEG